MPLQTTENTIGVEMKWTFDADLGKKHIHAEKVVEEETLQDPFLLGLAISTFTIKTREALIDQLKKLGYEVETLG